MALSRVNSGSRPQPFTEINMTPFVDVMLVLLVIFMVTLPRMTDSLYIELPEADIPPTTLEPTVVELAIGAEGQLFWNGVALSAMELDFQLNEAARGQPQPELHLRADKTTPYQRLADVMAAAQRNNLTHISFITTPQTP
jgi:biopolymer transport protein ExbD